MDPNQEPQPTAGETGSTSVSRGASWWRQPQRVWLRRALFQIHLWSGLGIGLYVLAISVSGSAVVFRNEIYEWADQGPRTVEIAGEPLTTEAFKARVAEQYPELTVSFTWPGSEPHHATEVWMDDDGERVQRLFDPYTGNDLGPSIPYAIQWASFFMDLHMDLLAGENGRWWNGVGAILMTLLTLTGLVIWWPGLARWKRNLWVDPRSGWKRINWDLHSSLGFWSFSLVFMWSVTGVFLVWPGPFQRFVNEFSPLIRYRLDIEEAVPPQEETGAAVVVPGGIFAQPEPIRIGVPQGENGKSGKSRPEPIRIGVSQIEDSGKNRPEPIRIGVSQIPEEAVEGTAEAGESEGPITLDSRSSFFAGESVNGGPGEGFRGKGKGRVQPRDSAGDTFLRWWYYLHFGNFMGWKVKALWVVLGLLPGLLFVTGAIMWWNRVVAPKFGRSRRSTARASQ